ncbi:hypothetical protein ATCV1_z815R [Acanthocystis turfacea chlorella virus 1]|uniref:Uncharacterized protein z815R n=1 Tax=Chlorovirus heliozoae TaxID=322019 RepID=A7KA75_9PHYC|nr:hypothetical protein ATCV1_z815R [Acanthocystis turfacea chlorella virus 1]ABT16949.1 hypothetical protein ATCV1_z815R [Acanthocystis turfacea chlorella virus 1]
MSGNDAAGLFVRYFQPVRRHDIDNFPNDANVWHWHWWRHGVRRRKCRNDGGQGRGVGLEHDGRGVLHGCRGQLLDDLPLESVSKVVRHLINARIKRVGASSLTRAVAVHRPKACIRHPRRCLDENVHLFRVGNSEYLALYIVHANHGDCSDLGGRVPGGQYLRPQVFARRDDVCAHTTLWFRGSRIAEVHAHAVERLYDGAIFAGVPDKVLPGKRETNGQHRETIRYLEFGVLFVQQRDCLVADIHTLRIVYRPSLDVKINAVQGVQINNARIFSDEGVYVGDDICKLRTICAAKRHRHVTTDGANLTDLIEKVLSLKFDGAAPGCLVAAVCNDERKGEKFLATLGVVFHEAGRRKCTGINVRREHLWPPRTSLSKRGVAANHGENLVETQISGKAFGAAKTNGLCFTCFDDVVPIFGSHYYVNALADKVSFRKPRECLVLWEVVFESPIQNIICVIILEHEQTVVTRLPICIFLD